MKGDQKLLLILLFVMGMFLNGCEKGNSQNEGISTPIEPSQVASLSTASTPVVTFSPIDLITPTISVYPTESNGCKKIAFAMINGTNYGIYTICPDGGSLTNITTGLSNNSHPSWSLDGRKIAFVSSRDGSNQIYVMDGNGIDPIKITSDYQNDFPI